MTSLDAPPCTIIGMLNTENDVPMPVGRGRKRPVSPHIHSITNQQHLFVLVDETRLVIVRKTE